MQVEISWAYELTDKISIGVQSNMAKYILIENMIFVSLFLFNLKHICAQFK